MVKYYITFLRFTIVSTVIRYIGNLETCVCVGGGVKFSRIMNGPTRGNFKVLILQRIPRQS